MRLQVIVLFIFEQCILVSEEDEDAIIVEPSKRGKLFILPVSLFC